MLSTSRRPSDFAPVRRRLLNMGVSHKKEAEDSQTSATTLELFTTKKTEKSGERDPHLHMSRSALPTQYARVRIVSLVTAAPPESQMVDRPHESTLECSNSSIDSGFASPSVNVLQAPPKCSQSCFKKNLRLQLSPVRRRRHGFDLCSPLFHDFLWPRRPYRESDR